MLNLLIVVCNVCWSAWGIFDKKALALQNPWNVLLVQYALALAEAVIVGTIVVTAHIAAPSNWYGMWLWTALGCATSTMAMSAYLVAMSQAEASYVLGITASYPLVMQFLASAFLHEPLEGGRIVGSILIGVGVYLIGKSAKVATVGATPLNKLVIVCISIATFGWGVHGLFDKCAVQCAPPLVVMLARTMIDSFTFACMYSVMRARKFPVQLRDKRVWALCSGSGCCLVIGYITYLQAMALSSASYVIVITGCYPLIMYLFAVVFLKEQVKPIRLAGVMLIVLGGVLVQLAGYK